MAMEVDTVPVRPSKRVRSATDKPNVQKNRRLFAPFRALGIITNSIVPAIQTRGLGKAGGSLNNPSITIVTSLGKSWAMWDVSGSMRLLFVGPQLQHEISSIVVENDSVFVAAGSSVYQYIRGRQVAELRTIESPAASGSSSSVSDQTISQLLIFGSNLLGLSSSGRKLYVWSLETDSLFQLSTVLTFEKSFIAKKMLHPATYLNKIVVSSADGRLQLWNISTGNIIHEFSRVDLLGEEMSGKGTFDEEKGYEITCLVQSPAIDVLAIGFASGRVIIYDIRQGEGLLSFTMSSTSAHALSSHAAVTPPITSLSFRTDNKAQTLATSDVNGNIALWDLDNGSKLSSFLRNAHDGIVGSVSFLPGQPVLVSTGADNAIRQWFFETPTSVPRLLKERSGHHGPPSLIRYYGSDGKALLTSSKEDRSLRYTSIVRDSRSFEMSQGAGMTSKAKSLGIDLKELKLSGVTNFSYSSGSVTGSGGTTASKKDFDDVLSAHEGDVWGRTWNVLNKKLGKKKFAIPDEKERDSAGVAKATCVTACGNFGLIGYEQTRNIHMWNMQSGIHRRSFKLPIVNNANKRERHVKGIETDALNTTVIASTLGGSIHFYDFHDATLKETVTLSSRAGIISTILQRDNNLLLLVCDDFVIRLLDIETKKVIREFFGFKGRVVDVAFSNDSRWLITSSTDSVIRTFDISTSQLIDAFKTPSIVSSLAFSPTGDFLATSMVDSVGIYLWTNRAQFSDMTLRSIDEDEVLKSQGVALPALQADDEAEAIPDDFDALEEAGHSRYHTLLQEGKTSSEQQLSSSLVTLSLLPRSRWQTLINLETINLRNKPKEPPKAPEQAPFFLPTLNGTEMKFDTTGNTNGFGTKEAETSEQSRRLPFGGLEVESDLIKALRQEDPLDEAFFKRLLALSAASLDLEIRSLGNEAQVVLFLRALTARLKSRKDFEAVQAMLNVLLTIHSDILIGTIEADEDAMEEDEDEEGETELQVALKEALEAQTVETKNVNNLLRTSLGMVAWARGVPVV